MSVPRRIGLLVLFAVALLVGALWWFGFAQPDVDELTAQAQAALVREDFQTAQSLAEQALARAPREWRALDLAATACLRQDRLDQAIEYWRRLPRDDEEALLRARLRAAEALEGRHHVAAAESQLRAILDVAPSHIAANTRLVHLLAVTARRWEAVPHLRVLVRNDRFTVDHLLLLFESRRIPEKDYLEACRAAAPGDAAVYVGLASLALDTNRRIEARQLLERAVELNPRSSDAQAALGRLLFQLQDWPAFAKWAAQLSDAAESHPNTWAVLGDWERRAGDKPRAVRCFWEAFRRDPHHREANHQLGQLLEQLSLEDAAAFFRDRAARHVRLKTLIDDLLASEQTSLGPIREIVALMEPQQRLLEAYGWSRIALSIDSRAAWAEEAIARLDPKDKTSAPTLPDLVAAVDFNEFPLPDRTHVAAASAPTGSEAIERARSVRFDDDAASAGLTFEYFNGVWPEPTRHKMYEFSGGGAGVLDFDLDGRPDVYFTQGADTPGEPSAARNDALFRNRGDGRFDDVTAHAGITELGYSQGVSIGDFNSDGFPDVFVADVGANRLFENNGDGTFTDATPDAIAGRDAWTTSCAFADLNGDALPDVFAANYLGGDDALTRVCAHEDGTPRACLPFQFAATPDDVFLNSGDGTFQRYDATDVPGKGLGVLVGDLDLSGKLGVFVANDTVPNQWLIAPQATAKGSFAMHDDALAAGLALSGSGRAEGCMGIAAGDVDHNGLLDLFVTNFYKETNTLYMQTSPGLFEDGTNARGLAAPSRRMLGFGTQFLDADLDGELDLIVTNGHVDDLRKYGRPYRMRAQVFYNDGTGHFIEADAETLGPFFEERHLGRGLARLDWNGDGRPDAVVSHLDHPAALLTNRTPRRGRYVSLALYATRSDRDAVGTTLIARTEKREFVHQLTAGDGYEASNERAVVIAVGDRATVDSLEVRWPSGAIETFENIATDARYALVEGGKPVRLPD
jgi:tetratricopeptide (TPR) repeat protein